MSHTPADPPLGSWTGPPATTETAGGSTSRAVSEVAAQRSAEGSADGATQVFSEHRELLFSIAYNILGTVADTEDVLQEGWLSWAARIRSTGEQTAGEQATGDHAAGEQATDDQTHRARTPGSQAGRTAQPIDNPRAYLVRVVVNQALARKAEISRRRETYVGPWLPEPLVTSAAASAPPGDAADPALRAEAVSMAMLVVLETLSPLERAVFVLYEVFGYAHPEIAEIVGRSPSAVRQLGHRAREHVHARRPRYQADQRLRRQVTERFVAAALGGDLEALLELMAPDVTLWGDGGGKAPAAGPRPIHGRDRVARLLAAAASRPPTPGVGYRLVNGDPSALLFAGDSLYAVMVLDLTPDGDQVNGVYIVTNPDKFSGVD